MTNRLTLSFGAADGIVPRDAVNLWRLDASAIPSTTRDLTLATGAAWPATGSQSWTAVPLTGCAGLDTVAHLTIAWAGWLDVAAIGFNSVCLASHLPNVGAGESILWLLGVQVLDPTRRICRMFLRWRQSNPALPPIYLDGPLFVMPSGTVLLSASRERTAAGYVGRFAVNGRRGGQSTALLLIGAAPAAMGSIKIMSVPSTETALTAPIGYVEFVDIQDRPACQEELELVGRRFAEITPRMEAAIRRYTGGAMRDVWSTDPDSIVQRELRVQAGLLAYARAELEMIGQYSGPGASWGEILERWELMAKLPVRAGDGFDERRARLITHLSLEEGNLSDMKAALAEPLGVDAADVVIEQGGLATFHYFLDNFTARVNDGSGYYSSGHDEEAWIKGSTAEWTFTNNAASAGYYRINRTLASDDLRWWGRILQIAAYRPPTDAHPPYYLHATGEGGENTLWQIRLQAMTVPADNIMSGLIIGDLEADDWTWIGIVRISGAWTVRWARRIGEDLTVAPSLRHQIGPTAWSASLGSVGASFAATSIRVRETETPGTWAVQFFVGANPSSWTAIATTLITGATPRPRWGGLGIIGLGTSVTGAVSTDWDYYGENSPRAPQHLTWHAFRDATIAGTYDLAAAQSVLDRYGPAHGDATAIERHRSLVYADATTLLDRDPIGT